MEHHACWCFGNFRSQGISRLSTDPTKLEYSISNVRRVKITASSPRGQWIINLYCSIATTFENLTYKTRWGRSKLLEILDTFEYIFLGKSLNIE